jgi:hypothetical protein
MREAKMETTSWSINGDRAAAVKIDKAVVV